MVPSFKLNNIIGAAANISRLISAPSPSSPLESSSSPSLLVENLEECSKKTKTEPRTGVHRRVKRSERFLGEVLVVKLNKVLNDRSNVGGRHNEPTGAQTRWTASRLKEVQPPLEPISGNSLSHHLVKGCTGQHGSSHLEMPESPGISSRLRSSGSLSSYWSSLASGQTTSNNRSSNRKREAVVDSTEEVVPIRKVKHHAKG